MARIGKLFAQERLTYLLNDMIENIFHHLL